MRNQENSISVPSNPIIKKLEAKLKNRAPSDCCKSSLVLENHICLNENSNPKVVKLFLAFEQFMSNFAQIDQYFSHQKMTE